MGRDSAIEWTDDTFNPWIGCAHVSPGCKHCYAETLMDTRWGRVEWGPTGTRVRTSKANWRKPRAWDREAAASGKPRYVFCASLADVYEDRPELEPWRDELVGLWHDTPNLVWLVLTKRPESVTYMTPELPDNVWIGTSIEDQRRADERIPILREIPTRLRWLSCEPLLGPVELDLDGIGWVIVGGESGHGARRMMPEWALSIREQCDLHGTPFLFKQWGEYDAQGLRVGKKLAGRVLDGVVHNARPLPTPDREE